MTTTPWLGIAQLILLVLWYTVAPDMPTWLVFLPLIIIAVMLIIYVLCYVFIAIVAGLVWLTSKSK